MFVGRGCLKQQCPSLWVLINHWENGYQEIHSSVFTKKQLLRYQNEANDLDGAVLFNKAYSTISVSFAARSGESYKLQWSDFHVMTDSVTKKEQYSVHYERSKKRGKKINSDNESLITGDVECAAISNFISYFPESERTGRFSRRIKANKIGELIGTALHVGKNVCAKVGYQIAKFLGLSKPESYTGHCWRGTAATILAEEGLTTQQIQRTLIFKIFVIQMLILFIIVNNFYRRYWA